MRRRTILRALESAVLLLALFLILFPIAWMALTAFKRPVDLFGLTFLFRPTFDNFRTVFGPPWNIGRTLWNSFVVALFTVMISIPFSTLAAYAFSRFEMRFKRGLFFAILATQFIPAVVVVLPFYLLFRDLGLLDTHLALVVVNLAIVTPFRTDRGDLWELIAAAGILISIPMFLLAAVIQRHFVRGMTGGAVK